MKFKRKFKFAKKGPGGATHTAKQLTKEVKVVKRKVKALELPMDNWYDGNVIATLIVQPVQGQTAASTLGTGIGTPYLDILGNIPATSVTVAAGGAAQTLSAVKITQRMGDVITLKKLKFSFDVFALGGALDYCNIRVVCFQMKRPNGLPMTVNGATLPRWIDVFRVNDNNSATNLTLSDIWASKTQFNTANINMIYDKVFRVLPFVSSGLANTAPENNQTEWARHGTFTHVFKKGWNTVKYNQNTANAFASNVQQNQIYIYFIPDDNANFSYTAKHELDYEG